MGVSGLLTDRLSIKKIYLLFFNICFCAIVHIFFYGFISKILSKLCISIHCIIKLSSSLVSKSHSEVNWIHYIIFSSCETEKKVILHYMFSFTLYVLNCTIDSYIHYNHSIYRIMLGWYLRNTDQALRDLSIFMHQKQITLTFLLLILLH